MPDNRVYPDITKSNEWFKRSQGLIPSHAQTLAKGPTQYVDGIAPKYLVSGKGSHVWDVDSNEFIDFNSLVCGQLALAVKPGAELLAGRSPVSRATDRCPPSLLSIGR